MLNACLFAPCFHFELAVIQALNALGFPAPQMAPMALEPHDFARASYMKALGRGLVSL